MANIFLISDLHLGHIGVTQFLNEDGSKLRPWDNIEDMDEALISNWNSVVTNRCKVYVLGDVVINRKHFHKLSRLNGEKVLVKGNHDLFRLEEYTPYFKDVRAYHVLDNMLMSHIPVHPHSQGRFRANIHGHLHSNNIMLGEEKDPFYFNVSVEQINYTPIAFESIRKHFSDL